MNNGLIRLESTRFYGDNAHYVDEDSATALEGFTQDKWPALVAACQALGGGDEPGIDCEVARTQETIEDFDTARTAHWSQRGTKSNIQAAGLDAVLFDCVQMQRGLRRFSIVVVDFGNARAVLTL